MAFSGIKNTLNNWSKPETIRNSITEESAKGAVTGATTGTFAMTIAGKPDKVSVGATGGAVLGGHIGAINGAISGGVKYAAGSVAKFFGWTD